jgi:hypothetical protein
MMYHLATHCRQCGYFSRFAILPIRNANLVKIENQFKDTPLDMFDGGTLVVLADVTLLGNGFRLDFLFGGTKNKRIYPSPSDWR